MKKKVCKACRLFVEESTCPNCKQNQFSTNWQGRLFVLDHQKSQIAKNLNITYDGEYAVKAR